jgi:hypothetical protein
MQRGAGLLALIALVGLPADTARAGVVPVLAELELRIGAPGVPVAFTTGASVVVNGSAAGPHVASLGLAAGEIATSSRIEPITDPAAFPIRGLQLTAANEAGLFAETTGGRLAGAMPLAGALRVCLFMPCSAAVANLSIPLAPVGGGGEAYATGAVSVTVMGAPWTTGTASVPLPIATYTAKGFAHGPLSGTTSTAEPGGVLQLVTPVRIGTSIPGDGQFIAMFGVLTLTVVPEPEVGVLLASGMLLIAAARRAAARRRIGQ